MCYSLASETNVLCRGISFFQSSLPFIGSAQTTLCFAGLTFHVSFCPVVSYFAPSCSGNADEDHTSWCSGSTTTSLYCTQWASLGDQLSPLQVVQCPVLSQNGANKAPVFAQPWENSILNSLFSHVMWGQKPVLLCWTSNSWATIPPAASPSPNSQDHPPEPVFVSVAHHSTSPDRWNMAALDPPQWQEQGSPGPLQSLRHNERAACVERRGKVLCVCQKSGHSWPHCLTSCLQPFCSQAWRKQDSWLLGNSFFSLFQLFLKLLPLMWLPFRSGSRHQHHQKKKAF